MANIATQAGASLSTIAEKVRSLAGWRRAFLAFFAGVCGALSMAPFYLLPLLAIAFTILVLLIDAAAEDERKRLRAFAAGWWWGFGYFLAGVYWMAFSFFVQADQFAWMAPFAVTAMPAFLALFTGVSALIAVMLWRGGWARVFLFAAVFSIFEYLRGHILTGLPWNLAGQSLAGNAAGAQTAAWWGAYGLSLTAILFSCAPAAGLASSARPIRALSGLIAAFLGALFLFVIGGFRLMDGDATTENNHDAYVRIVQPNIGQRDKIDPDKWGENFYRNLNLSKGTVVGDAPLYVIWPENAAPYLYEATTALDILHKELPANATLIAGAVRREADESGADRYFNSVSILQHQAAGIRLAGFYDKHHLVPFGEYLPFYGLLNAVGLAQLTPYGDAGFAAGEGPSILSAGGTSFAPLICYEAIFPGALYPKGERPRWLVTVTNDAWFGDTSGPRQHLDQARLRSIESGLPMARSANTGVSALIDAKGRIVERIALYEGGRIDAPLPRALPPTLYDRFGDTIYFLMVVFCFAAAFGGRQFVRAMTARLQPLRERPKR